MKNENRRSNEHETQMSGLKIPLKLKRPKLNHRIVISSSHQFTFPLVNEMSNRTEYKQHNVFYFIFDLYFESFEWNIPGE